MKAGIGGLVTFKDSNWLLSIVLPHQRISSIRTPGRRFFWGYSLFGDRHRQFRRQAHVRMHGRRYSEELCGHLRFDAEVFKSANCIPAACPTSPACLMPRLLSDRPVPVPPETKNSASFSQFVEIPEDVVFTVEYSIRAAQMAVYQLLEYQTCDPSDNAT